MRHKKRTVLGALMFCLVATGCSPSEARSTLKTVQDVDLERYSGKWYEIARLPNKFQKTCVSDVDVQYDLRQDGRVDVLNRCRTAEGDETSAKGVARRAGKDGPASKLKVRFAPAFLSFIPAVWGDYQIIDLAPDYSWAVVGEPARRYLWVLAREKQMDQSILDPIVERAAAQGYDVTPLIRTLHTD